MAVGKAHLFALATLSTVLLAPAAHGTVRGSKTTAPDVFVTIRVTITDTRISLDRHSAPRGAEGRFVIRNAGKKPHTFTFGSTARSGAQQTGGFSRRLKANSEATLLLFFDYRGPLPYRSILPADRPLPGMHGTFTIR